MKTKEPVHRTVRLTADSQSRLIAYSTAASLGAFFAGQHAEAQGVVESAAFSSYPATLSVGTSPADYNYFSVDGSGNEFHLTASATRVSLTGIPSTTSKALNPTSNGYIVPWTVGSTIGPSSGTAPGYKAWLAEDHSGSLLFNNFSSMSVMGFEFVSPTDDQTHYGYMYLQVTTEPSAPGSITAVTVDGIFWNETAGAAITVGADAVPEPSSLALLAAGLVGMAARRARRQQVK